jgi:hypothetical protein
MAIRELLQHNAPDELIEAANQRNVIGIERYGVPLSTHDGRDTRVDLMQELLDAFAYTEKLKVERELEEGEDAAKRISEYIRRAMVELHWMGR